MNHCELELLLGKGEGATLEFKESLPGSFARELVALANSEGGIILLGVRDNGTVKGIDDSNALRARIQDIGVIVIHLFSCCCSALGVSLLFMCSRVR